MTNDELLSCTIRFLRFPLAVGVVLIHCNISTFLLFYEEGAWPWVNNIVIISGSIFPSICVPTFFFISGFLFFYNSEFSKLSYMKKIKSRFHTLLVPYLIWNFIGFLFLLVKVHPQFISLFPSLHDFRIDIEVFLKCFWIINLPNEFDENIGAPIDFPFWYIRDLMILVILTPAIYWITKRLRLTFIIILGLIWFFDIIIALSIPKISGQSIFFFPLGAYFSINRLNPIDIVRKANWAPWVYVFCIIAVTICKTEQYSYWMNKIGIIIGMIAVFNITSTLLLKRIIHVNVYLSNVSFFVFALHGLFITKFINVSMTYLHPQTPYVFLLVYFLVPIITILVCIGVYQILRQWLPSLTKVVMGGR